MGKDFNGCEHISVLTYVLPLLHSTPISLSLIRLKTGGGDGIVGNDDIGILQTLEGVRTL